MPRMVELQGMLYIARHPKAEELTYFLRTQGLKELESNLGTVTGVYRLKWMQWKLTKIRLSCPLYLNALNCLLTSSPAPHFALCVDAIFASTRYCR